MAIPELVLATAQRQLSDFCAAKVPVRVRDQIRLEVDIDGNALTLLECRPPWSREWTEWSRSPIARFRYKQTERSWQLFWSDRNSKWHVYDLVAPSREIGPLLAEVDRDPTAIFWG